MKNEQAKRSLLKYIEARMMEIKKEERRYRKLFWVYWRYNEVNEQVKEAKGSLFKCIEARMMEIKNEEEKEAIGSLFEVGDHCIKVSVKSIKKKEEKTAKEAFLHVEARMKEIKKE